MGFCCLIAAWALLPAAAYSLSEGPQKLGTLNEAELESLETGRSGVWIEAAGELERTGLSFTRKGAPTGFLLTRLAARNDFWVILPVTERVHESGQDYIPPRTFSGRLLRKKDLTLALHPIERLVNQQGGEAEHFLLLEGASPRTHRVELIAAILLALVGLSTLGLSFFLTRTDRTAPSALLET